MLAFKAYSESNKHSNDSIFNWNKFWWKTWNILFVVRISTRTFHFYMKNLHVIAIDLTVIQRATLKYLILTLHNMFNCQKSPKFYSSPTLTILWCLGLLTLVNVLPCPAVCYTVTFCWITVSQANCWRSRNFITKSCHLKYKNIFVPKHQKHGHSL